MSDKIDINKIAKLARLKLTEAEIDQLGEYLKQVIDYIDKLNQLDTTNIETTSQQFVERMKGHQSTSKYYYIKRILLFF